MIKSIQFRNFLSFYPEGRIDFSVNEHAPDTFHFTKCGHHRLSKGSAILGANGSGKSNVLKAISYLVYFIAHSFSETKEKKVYNGFHEAHRDQLSYFEAEFYVEQILHKYSLQIDKNRVLLEKLEHCPQQKMCLLYDREYDPSKDSYNFKNTIGLKDDFITMVRSDASVISTGSQFNHKKLDQIKNYWNLAFSLSPPSPLLSFETTNIFQYSKFYFENKSNFDHIKKYLKQVDLGLSDISIEKKEHTTPEGQTDTVYLPYGIHKHKNQEFKIPFIYESLGTQKLYFMLGNIFFALDSGSLFIIDEIESSLHPDMLPFILSLFVSPESNSKGAQLLCTTHAPTLLSELSKYQIFLTEKNQNCESEIYRLDDVKDVRADDNLFRKYLAGTYGGIPNIDT